MSIEKQRKGILRRSFFRTQNKFGSHVFLCEDHKNRLWFRDGQSIGAATDHSLVQKKMTLSFRIKREYERMIEDSVYNFWLGSLEGGLFDGGVELSKPNSLRMHCLTAKAAFMSAVHYRPRGKSMVRHRRRRADPNQGKKDFNYFNRPGSFRMKLSSRLWKIPKEISGSERIAGGSIKFCRMVKYRRYLCVCNHRRSVSGRSQRISAALFGLEHTATGSIAWKEKTLRSLTTGTD